MTFPSRTVNELGSSSNEGDCLKMKEMHVISYYAKKNERGSRRNELGRGKI